MDWEDIFRVIFLTLEVNSAIATPLALDGSFGTSEIKDFLADCRR